MPWFVQVMGETLGPFANAELVQMAASGKIQHDTLVAQQAAGPWVAAANVRGLFGAARPADAAPSAAGRTDDGDEPETAAAETTEVDTAAVARRANADGPYKVITQRDPGFAGKFDPDRIEGVINAYAASGWKVCGVATTTFTTLAGKREEVIVLMERPGGTTADHLAGTTR